MLLWHSVTSDKDFQGKAQELDKSGFKSSHSYLSVCDADKFFNFSELLFYGYNSIIYLKGLPEKDWEGVQID